MMKPAIRMTAGVITLPLPTVAVMLPWLPMLGIWMVCVATLVWLDETAPVPSQKGF